MSVPRYVPDRPLPPYAFEPGEHPHPTRDPRGHSHGRGADAPDIGFAWGVDLYNHGFFWEAHEAWEDLWRMAEPESAEASFFQGLIQCAAACMKVRGGDPSAARRIADRATGHLAHAVEEGAHTLGLDLPTFAHRFREWIDTAPEAVEGRPRIVLA